jgi:hypothetical protein
LDKRGNFARCGGNETNSCQAKQLLMPQVR